MRKVGSLSYRTKRELLHSQTDLLDNCLISEENMILPECYVDTEAVENIFRTPARLLYAISRNENLEMELDNGILHKTKYCDNELYGSITGLCQENFHKNRIEELSIEQRCSLAKILHKKYGIAGKQLSRLTNTDLAILKKIL